MSVIVSRGPDAASIFPEINERLSGGGIMEIYKMGFFNPTDANYANLTLSVVFVVLTGVPLLPAFTIMKTFER
ncbi:MAG: hypothetical protein D084_Lepto4C00101G0002 [Leptospirillum sp. Group IV 'UBA BS']|nr:MAG: hypothetical protein D084_Lepto4C00101G0002 [Leptospirillum sp. Group IV 'UBA BS']